jgi:hypothetical protein
MVGLADPEAEADADADGAALAEALALAAADAVALAVADGLALAVVAVAGVDVVGLADPEPAGVPPPPPVFSQAAARMAMTMTSLRMELSPIGNGNDCRWNSRRWSLCSRRRVVRPTPSLALGSRPRISSMRPPTNASFRQTRTAHTR